MSEIEIHVYKVLTTGCVSLLVAYLTAKLALNSFFKQKEYELVKERYLNDGVDKIRAYNVKIITDYGWNYVQVQKCLARAYHGETSFLPEACLKTLREIDGLNACGLEYTRVSRLLNDESLWELNEYVVSNILGQNENLTRIVETLKCADKTSPTALLKLKSEIEESHSELQVQMGCVASFLTQITDLLEESHMEYSAVKSFSLDADVSSLVDSIRDLWHTEKPKS